MCSPSSPTQLFDVQVDTPRKFPYPKLVKPILIQFSKPVTSAPYLCFPWSFLPWALRRGQCGNQIGAKFWEAVGLVGGLNPADVAEVSNQNLKED